VAEAEVENEDCFVEMVLGEFEGLLAYQSKEYMEYSSTQIYK